MKAWGDAEKQAWFEKQTIKRSYQQEVVPSIEALKSDFDVASYGSLSIDPTQYPVYVVKSKNMDPKKKTVVITGGVHGYETSGVHGAIAFMRTAAPAFSQHFNFVCAPCLSPWGYETINRWNKSAIDPNRSFMDKSPAEECSLFLTMMKSVAPSVDIHFDLHETTDSDNTTFRPALAQRDGKEEKFSEIPDGFYVVGDTRRPQPEFQKAIIDSVRKVTHIAPPDSEGNIIGVPLDQEGVISYDKSKLFLCGGFSNAKFTTTTEVYPDSPKATPQICIDAQVAAIVGGLNYVLGALR
jgi:hypothetical protein